MCAVFGFLDYKGKVSNAILKKLIHYLSVSAEVRGTDATGIAYVRDGSIVTYKKPKPAHKVKLFFPRGTRSVIGHTRFTTQGSEKRNCNNHPFEGHCGTESFTLAHNGVLYNDRELRREQHLPPTPIETDSYIAVQLLEQGQQLDTENIKRMAELVEGSFVFTILRNDNTLFLVKGNNPLALYHFPALGLYVYASTKSILDNCSLPRKTQKTDTQNEKNAPEHHVQERFLLPINGVLPLFYPFNFSSILATCRKICLSVSLLLVSFSVSSFGLSVVVVAFFANPFSPAALMIAG